MTPYDALQALVLLAAGHAVADGLLQPARLSRAKASRHRPTRWQALSLHGLIHGAFVAVIMQSWALGAAEAVCHALVDRAKGRRLIGSTIDQLLHGAFKLLWVGVAWGVNVW